MQTAPTPLIALEVGNLTFILDIKRKQLNSIAVAGKHVRVGTKGLILSQSLCSKS